MASFDPMAAAVDWLDAYRAADLSIVEMYSADAALQCDCNGAQQLHGRAAIRAYWQQRFIEKPAGELTNLNLFDGGIVVSYRVSGGVVNAVLFFDGDGKIRRSRCRPS
ncbi:nuclear transport factor 2 family protein [Bradyrhizobium sp. JYMT SZCCT0428]|uniref:nuclear transport factor 2 family protein n=1 Tax=Bradyrhizobium sp. JYMT SZCCT0428 TaxID=2807673 RepID=UPI001BA8FBCB|nr:nuclear transport factor 2 family protein [Bradyrhizobium sp. JYMT SZCCT0428]MBR1154285.1 nuclear transport factor 2 family protein [Bradyrhizobium sp. JYMT SZCCT0428]